MDFALLFQDFPPEIATLIIASLPIAELRGAIPVGIGIYKLDPLLVYILSVVGNIIPAFFILWLIGPASGYLMQRFGWAHSFFEWLFARTRHKFVKKYEKWGHLALIIFVAIPLPLTGVWTGSLAAFLFGIPKKVSLALLTVGAALAGVIVSATTLGLINIF